MPRRGAGLLVCLTAVLAVVSSTAVSQDAPHADGIPTYYWPSRVFNIPVDVDRISKLNPKPTHLQLYYAQGRGQWQKGARLPLGGLKDLNDGKKGFEFTARQDGEHEFTVQYVYPDGTTSPKNDELGPQIRIVIDTTPPTVRLVAAGNGVEWAASDDNLDPRDPKAVTLECRWARGGNWQKITDRAFRPADRYAWQLRQGDVLEVRVLVKDQAGHEGVSPIVRVPGDGATGAGLSRDWPPRNPADPLTRPGVESGGSVPQPSIFYVNTLNFDVEYKIQTIGRSGVRAAYLFVLRDQGPWQPVKKPFAVNLMPSEKDKTLSLPYEVTEDGLYGFFVIPESGAGRRAPDPTKADHPMVYVEVDTKPPFAKIEGQPRVTQGARNPLVEITWRAEDRNLMPRPVSLEYSVDKDAPVWQQIKYQLDNNLTKETGRYVWEVPDDHPWKFWVRVRAVDKAANTTTYVYPEQVIIDLETPTAGINTVRGSKDGGPGPGKSNPPPVSPKPTTPPAGGSDAPVSPKLPELPPKQPGEPGA